METRNAWPPLLAVAGLVAGLIVAATEPTLYRSQVTLVAERNSKPATDDASLTRSFAELATSDIVLRNVSQKLGTSVERDRLHVHAGNGVVKLAYDAGSRVQAARVAQQVAVDFSQAVANRFGGSGVQANVFDPPHDTGRVSPHILRDGGLGLLVGLIAAGIVWLRPRHGLRERGRWRVSALSDAVEASAAEYPDRIEDWRAYIAVLRAQAEDDLLPYALDGVVREVFAPILTTSETGS
jgi:capsular polysaccharide biosynthesis protein